MKWHAEICCAMSIWNWTLDKNSHNEIAIRLQIKRNIPAPVMCDWNLLDTINWFY